MKVDFHIDEFGKVFLFQTTNLIVRLPRKVPTEDSTMLADFILQKIVLIEKAEKPRIKPLQIQDHALEQKSSVAISPIAA